MLSNFILCFKQKVLIVQTGISNLQINDTKPTILNETSELTFAAGNGSWLIFEIDWGDGTTETVSHEGNEYFWFY